MQYYVKNLLDESTKVNSFQSYGSLCNMSLF